MSDRFLARAWWMATMSLILFCGIGSLFAAYHGMFALFAHRYAVGFTGVVLCGPLAICAFLLCKHRGDLVCD